MYDHNYHEDASKAKKVRLKHPLLLGLLLGMAVVIGGALAAYGIVVSQNTIKLSIVPRPTPIPQTSPNIPTGYVITDGSFNPVSETLQGVCTQADIDSNSFGCGEHNAGDLVTYTVAATCDHGWHEVPHLANGYAADHRSSVLSKVDEPPVSVGYFLIYADHQYYLDEEKNYSHTSKTFLFGATTVVGYEIYAVPEELAGLQSFYQRYEVELGASLTGWPLCQGL